MKKKYLTIVFMGLSLSVLLFTSCEGIFDTWFDVPSEQRDVIWKSVDGVNSDGYEILNNYYMNSGSKPVFAVFNNELYAAWIEGSMVYVKKYNGDDDNPHWDYMWSNSADSVKISFAVFNGELFLSYTLSTNVNVIRFDVFKNWVNAGDIGSVVDSKLFVFGDNLYIVFADPSIGRIKRYLGAASWSASDELSNDVTNGINDNANPILGLDVAVQNGELYISFREGSSLKVRKYFSGSWITSTSDFSYANAATAETSPVMINFNNNLYISWEENNRICVKTQDNYGWYWLDDGADNPDGLKYNSVSDSSFPVLTDINNRLVLLWIEVDTIRARYLKDDDMNKSLVERWPFLDGGESTGISYNGNVNSASSIDTIGFNNKLYLIFSEWAGAAVIHVKVGY